MIIGFEAKRVYQNFSGLGNYSRNTINLLARFYPENSYKLFAPKQTDLFKLPDCAEVITPKTNLFRFLKSYWRLHVVSKLLKENNIEIFHGLSHVLPYGIEKTSTLSVVTIHDLIFMRFPEFYKKVDRKLYQSVYQSSCIRANKIIAISHQTKTDLMHFFGIEPSKIEVVYQSCNSCFYERVSDLQKSAIRIKFNLPQRFILCVGTIEKRKNQLAILKALVLEKLDIPFVILGKGCDYMNQLNDFISKANLQKQVIFLHNTNLFELQAIYQMAEIMIYPSYFEGFGLPVLEAQASGCPVITSNVSSLPEAGGDGALYNHPDDIAGIGQSIRSIITDKGLRDDLIRKGTANAERFIEQHVAENLMKVYKELMEG